jgi:density-regulated protein DRP1
MSSDEGDNEVVGDSVAKINMINGLPVGPQPNLNYPLEIVYCGECTLPLEYCEYSPTPDKCRVWIEKNLPDHFEKLMKDEDGKDICGGEEKKRQKRGGRGVIKAKKKPQGPQKVTLARSSRGKKKFVTVITGLNTFDIDLKDAAKYFAHKFSCGSSVTGDSEIVVQGDVKDDLFDIIPEKWPEIDEDSIEDMGDMKR